MTPTDFAQLCHYDPNAQVPNPNSVTVSVSPIAPKRPNVTSLNSQDLMKEVSDEHKKFIADLVWIHEEDNVYIETEKGLESCKLIAVHGGLERGKDVGEQIIYLKEKDTRIPNVEPLRGRKSIWDIPEVYEGDEKLHV